MLAPLSLRVSLITIWLINASIWLKIILLSRPSLEFTTFKNSKIWLNCNSYYRLLKYGLTTITELMKGITILTRICNSIQLFNSNVNILIGLYFKLIIKLKLIQITSQSTNWSQNSLRNFKIKFSLPITKIIVFCFIC